jgi:hypothetical protein
VLGEHRVGHDSHARSDNAANNERHFSVAQISPGFMNVNLVAFYLVRPKVLFLFYGRSFGLANRCHVFREVPAVEIAQTLNAFIQFDLNWLLLITSPQLPTGQIDTSSIENPGAQFAFQCDANTFPKGQTGST